MPNADATHIRRVLVVALGGTIAMTAGPAGVAPALSAAQLVDAVPGLDRERIHVEVVDFRRTPGASLRFADLDALSTVVRDQAQAGVDGVVVTQGTDSIEETAYHLDLHHREALPLVVIGAMRNPTLAGADGPANLLAAIRTAADPSPTGSGVWLSWTTRSTRRQG